MEPWVKLPHCFNALDACDPDTTYFRGHGWYRTKLKLRNPFRDGHTLLHFQGAGQTTSLWIGSRLIGKHAGGYDEFAFDITEAVADIADSERAAGVPVVILCDNSPDRDRLPSDLSDFFLYGGLYRHVESCLPARSRARDGSYSAFATAGWHGPGFRLSAALRSHVAGRRMAKLPSKSKTVAAQSSMSRHSV